MLGEDAATQLATDLTARIAPFDDALVNGMRRFRVSNQHFNPGCTTSLLKLQRIGVPFRPSVLTSNARPA